MQSRLGKELADLSSNPIVEKCVVYIADGNMNTLKVDISGPAGTPYEGGLFRLIIDIPQNYPFKPPKFKFETKIYNPRVTRDSGEFCEHIGREGWGPVKNIRWVIGQVIIHLITPRPNHVVESEIFRQMQDNYEEFADTAKKWVQQFAR